MGGHTLELSDEDISKLALDIHDWLQHTPLASSEEGFDWLYDLIYDHLEPFSIGIRNFN